MSDEQALEREAVCERHGRFMQRVISVMGREIGSKCPACAEEAERRSAAQEEERRRGEIERARQVSGIPLRFQRATFAGYRATRDDQRRALEICRSYAEGFAEAREAGVCLCLVGNMGTGKSHLASATASQVLAGGYSVLFTTVGRLIREVRSTYRKDARQSEDEVLAGFVKPDLLVLDEVGVQRGTDAERLTLTEIIGMRYESVRPTVLVGNCTRDELAENLGDRVVDRLQEGGGAIIACNWESWRRDGWRATA